MIKETPVTSADPFGLSFTLKANTSIVRNLKEVLFALSYDTGAVNSLSNLFMFKATINAEAVFTTPLFLATQPHLFVRYGPWTENGVLKTPADRWVQNRYANKGLLPWTEVVSKRGDIQAYLSRIASDSSYPNSDANAFNHGLITVKTPGVYLINGMVQFTGVTALIQGMEVALRVNKNASDYQHACKIGPVQDGGVPFSFCIFISEFDINSKDTAIAKAQGEAYLQINVCYNKGSSSLDNLKFVKDDGRFCWCTVTHLG